ncbi:MAG: peptide chain release factor N(5)-glutamine methyltransferase [Bdellovibrionales bacterium]|nr:peptide chain release factor N(5)-glutamine methyltransferase [Bdellovibrionales bacterium]
MTVGEALALARASLPDHEAERALEHALREPGGARLTRLDLFERSARPLGARAHTELKRVIEGRLAGIPLQHLTRTQVFLDHEYECGPEALIPRPETEVLVEDVIRTLRAEAPILGWELGLGSGVISLELLAGLPSLRMKASEREPGAAALARRNAARILENPLRLEIAMAPSALSGWESFGGFADLGADRPGFLVSNPPYLDPSRDELQEEVRRHEPASALFVDGADPLHFYRRTAEQGLEILAKGGYVWMEIAHERAAESLGLFSRPGWRAELVRDLGGRERVLRARRI